MIYTKTYTAPPIEEDEILRYAGVREKTDEMTALMRDVMVEAEGVLTYKVCWNYFDLTRDGNVLDFGFAKLESSALALCLDSCERAVVFAATVGIGLDRLIAKYGTLSPSKALMLQAIGAERIESLCDEFCGSLQNELVKCGGNITRRFSPGYGDLTIGVQEDVFRVLDCSRQIGLTLNESMLMSPSKSVTAIIGIKIGEPDEKKAGACELCGKTDCLFRRNK